MRDLRTLSGLWTGFFVLGKRRGTVSAHLLFSSNNVAGRGADFRGSFNVSGEYFPEERRVMLDKAYADCTVFCDGRWDGELIAGRWSFSVVRVSEEGTVRDADSGVFEIWPSGDEHALKIGDEPRALPEPEG